MKSLSPEHYLALIDQALAEDIGTGDVTTLALVPEDRMAQAAVVTRQGLVVAGIGISRDVFKRVDSTLKIELRIQDGKPALENQQLMIVKGKARSILAAERVALNFLQRLSGIATLTRSCTDFSSVNSCRLLDTRKTTPGWRKLEKYAVRCGGGVNHREGLFDMVLIKDNHLALLTGSQEERIKTAVAACRRRYPSLAVVVETESMEQVEAAIQAKPDRIMLDNMCPDCLREAVTLIGKRCKTEASGGISMEEIPSVAETGVDYISLGGLTNTVPSMDISLEMVEE